VSLLAAAAALRPQLSGIGPLLGPIGRDLGISHAEAGLLATIPVACMGMFAPVSAGLMRRFGTYRVMTASLVAISAAGLLRAIAPETSTVIALTVVFGIGAGVAGTLLPGLVKTGFAARATQVTALYSVALNGAAAVSAALAAPIASIVGGWRGALAVFGAWDVAVAITWAATAHRAPGGRASPSRRPAATAGEGPGPQRAQTSAGTGPVRPARPMNRARAHTWILAVVFGLQGTLYYGLNAWLAEAYRERGWGAASAGALVGVLNFSTLPATLAVAALARRMLNRFRYLMVAAGGLALAMLGIVLVPGGGVAWSALAGVGLGTIFPLCMAATVDFGHDAHEVTRATGIMLGGGYLIAALAPVALGALRDRTGSFTAGIWMLLGISLILLAICAFVASRVGDRLLSGRGLVVPS
jgi:CP family cyanate transporter-like MFS transporter